MHQENTQAKASENGALVTCIECGKAFSANEVIRFGEYNVCADCKPAFQQKLAEGSFVPGKMDYAGIWRRFWAVSLDGIIVWFAFFSVGLFAGMLGFGSVFKQATGIAALLSPLFSIAIGATYAIVFIGKMGATPGKMAMGIKVVRPDGSPVSMGQSAGRYFSTMISGFTLGIGYLIAFFDDERKTLHDRIAGTRVIRL
jgi:uncharacterized RDD family membrane protein YckC